MLTKEPSVLSAYLEELSEISFTRSGIISAKMSGPLGATESGEGTGDVLDGGGSIVEDLEDSQSDRYSDGSLENGADEEQSVTNFNEAENSNYLGTKEPTAKEWGFHTLGHFDFGSSGNMALGCSETLWKASQAIIISSSS